MREPRRAPAPGHDDHARRSRRERCVQPAPRRAAGARAARRLCGSPGVLPRDRDAHADTRLGHPDRGLAARRGLERQVPGGGQRRLAGGDRPPGSRRSAPPRLRDRGHGHGTHERRDGRELGARPPGEGDRLRLAGRAPDDGARQGDRGGFLRRAAEALLLERLLLGRQAGAEGSPAVPGGLRRHRRRRARERLDASHGVVGVGGARRSQGQGQLHSTGEVRAPAQGGARRLRRARRSHGPPDRRPPAVPLRPRRPALHRRRRAELPDGRPGRLRAAALRPGHVLERKGVLPGARAGQRARLGLPARRPGADGDRLHALQVPRARRPGVGSPHDRLRQGRAARRHARRRQRSRPRAPTSARSRRAAAS